MFETIRAEAKGEAARREFTQSPEPHGKRGTSALRIYAGEADDGGGVQTSKAETGDGHCGVLKQAQT